MATSKVDINIMIDDADFRASLKQFATSSKLFAKALSSIGPPMRSLTNLLKDTEKMSFDGSVSRKEFQELAEKYGRVSQRFTMLLSLIGIEELKRLDLLEPDAKLEDVDGWDRVYVLKARQEDR